MPASSELPSSARRPAPQVPGALPTPAPGGEPLAPGDAVEWDSTDARDRPVVKRGFFAGYSASNPTKGYVETGGLPGVRHVYISLAKLRAAQ